jgi:CBS domain-containing protein
MVQRGIRHLPVTQEGKVVGVVSIRDLVRFGVEALGRGHERSKEILEAAGH